MESNPQTLNYKKTNFQIYIIVEIIVRKLDGTSFIYLMV